MNAKSALIFTDEYKDIINIIGEIISTPHWLKILE